MTNNEKILSTEDEKIILQRQGFASAIVAVLIILLIIGQFVDLGATLTYLFLLSPLLLFYIGISSIKNRISMFHFLPRGGISRGNKAVMNGVIAILTGIIYFIFFGITPFQDLFSKFF